VDISTARLTAGSVCLYVAATPFTVP